MVKMVRPRERGEDGVGLPACHVGPHTGKIAGIPAAYRAHGDEAERCHDKKPHDVVAVVGRYDEGHQQRAYRSAEIAPDLKHRLGKASALMACERGDARCLGMESGRSDANHKYRHEHPGERGAPSQQDDAYGGAAHTGREAVDKGPLVKSITHHRLEY